MSATGTAEQSERTGVLWWVGRIVSFALLFFLVAVLLAAVLIPKIGGAQPYTILTSSMEPNYPPGTLVVVRAVDPDAIALGTVVTYQIRSGEPEVITHRVVGIGFDKDGARVYTTQGDRNPQPDPTPVKPVQIRGSMWYSLPYLGYVNNWFSGGTRALGIYLAAGALGLYALWQFASATRDRVRRRPDSRHTLP